MLLAPVWLLLLLPWAGLSAWLLIGHRRREAVTGVFLWERDAPASTNRRARRPPVAIVLLLLGLLTGVIALARPVRSAPSWQNVLVIVDRGPGLAAIEADGRSRRSHLLDRLVEWTSDERMPIAIRFVPADPLREARTLAEACVAPDVVTDTHEAIIDAVREAQRQGKTVLVLTDAPMGSSDGVVMLSPDHVLANAGVERVVWANGQLMVSIRNERDSAIDLLTLDDLSGRRRVPIDPVPAHARDNRFVDVAGPPEWLGVSIDGEDAMPWDDAAYLARVPGDVKLVAGQGLPEPVRRVVAAHAAARPATDTARLVSITRDGSIQSSAIIVAGATDEASGDVSIDDPILAGMRLPTRGPIAHDGPTGLGWRTIAHRAGRPIVAVRTTPARQAWIGFDAGPWAREVDFVLFWSALIDWIAERPTPTMAAIGVSELPHDAVPDTTHTTQPTISRGPGLYRRDGELFAVNRSYVDLSSVHDTPDLSNLLRERFGQQRMDHTVWALAGVVAAVGAALLVSRKR
ncbi:MAG: hypothetical protein QM770_05290 [Tepidisphaeraceae bacterium]